MRAKRGADAASDHHLLLMTVKLRLIKHTTTTSTRTRYNVGLLRSQEIEKSYQISLRNRYQILQKQSEDGDTETHWQQTRKMYLDTCEEVLGKKTTKHKDWVSVDTLQRLKERKEKKEKLNTSKTRSSKAKAQEEYTQVNKEVKKSFRKDKRAHIENLAQQAEKAAGQGNLKDLYMITKKLAGRFQQTDKPVKDKEGNKLTTTEDQRRRWGEHFTEVLNRSAPEEPPDIPPAKTELPIDSENRKSGRTRRNTS